MDFSFLPLDFILGIVASFVTGLIVKSPYYNSVKKMISSLNKKIADDKLSADELLDLYNTVANKRVN